MGTLLNRRRYMGGGAYTPLPYDAEVEYLQSSGTQVINTGIPVKNIGKYITYCQFENASSAKAEGSTETSKYYFIGKNAQNKFYSALNATVTASTTSNDAGWHKFELDVVQGRFLIDNNIVNTFAVGYVDSNIKFALFACNGQSQKEGGYAFNISGKKQWAKIYDLEGNLLRDYISVRISQTGYMYDRVSGQLFGNVKTGQFIVGPDKNL